MSDMERREFHRGAGWRSSRVAPTTRAAEIGRCVNCFTLTLELSPYIHL
jgi:hypothetical protein